MRHASDFGDAQCQNPDDENHITFHSGSEAAELQWEAKPGWHPWDQGFSLSVKKGVLRRGDIVTVHMGGKRGYRAQSFSEVGAGFRLGVKTEPDAPWIVSPREDARMFDITGGDASGIKAYVKDINNVDPHKTVCVKVEDIYSNIGVGEDMELDVLLDDRIFLGILTVAGGEGGDTAISREFTVPDDGKWHTLTLASRDGKFFSRTNPFGPSLLQGYGVYFGDIALGFSASGGGGNAVMGDDVFMETGSDIQFDFHAVCHGFFERVDIYVNNDLVKSYHNVPQSWYINQVTEYRNTYRDTVKSGVNFYWVKIIQVDGGIAWSSPIFVHGT
ncbi:MAG: hypothetical protein FWD61_15590 [Phycisphaerales bacterium]|nr:hypothetical protein [Phycisphaerales bacterium]